jgi:hypothetical protein
MSKLPSFPVRVIMVGVLSCLAFVGGARLVARSAQAANRHTCSKDLKHRTAAEAIRQHLAALQAGDLDTAMCDFDEDAVVLLAPLDGPSPGGPDAQVVTGLDNIRSGLAGVVSLLGGFNVPQIQTFLSTASTVQITFTAVPNPPNGAPCIVPDGSDTYVVEKGLIVVQTVHDTFKSAPGQSCPVSAPGS